jgi:hypothetical protein
MPGTFPHAASVLGAACLVVTIACEPASEDVTPPATLAFITDPTHEDFGVAVVAPVRAGLLDGFERMPDETRRRLLSVHVGDTLAAPVLGTWEVARDTLRYRLRFAPAAGVTYVARWDAAALDGADSTGIEVWTYTATSEPPTTVVSAVYPTADSLPMNLLRMYVQFSAPMTTGRSYEHIRLFVNGDSLLDEPFFTGGDAIELWDPEKTRLTLLFDPGRIKRDLLPHQQRGLPLHEGLRYRLVIDSAWHDAEGRPLAGSFEKVFSVGSMDRNLVRTVDWRLSAPSSGTREPLVVRFPGPLDVALLARLLVVRDSGGNALVGEIAISDEERQWSFVPTVAWRRAPHWIEVDTELEDPAGNNLRRLFDVAPGDTGAIGTDARVVIVPFRPR